MFRGLFNKSVETKVDRIADSSERAELRDKLKRVAEYFRPFLNYSHAVREANYFR